MGSTRKGTDPIESILTELSIIDPGSVKVLASSTRDEVKTQSGEPVRVLRCDKSGVIFLSSSEHVSEAYYADQPGTSYWSTSSRHDGLQLTAVDDERRAEALRPLVSGKRYLDVGTGLGGVLELVKSSAHVAVGVEPQSEIRAQLCRDGLTVHADIADIPKEQSFDVISLFHVFEHLTDPLRMLRQVGSRLEKGGKVIVEVPHARDALIYFFNLESFRRFTFWGEHLILHTRESLERFFRAADYRRVTISGLQRYPLANHLHWLARNAPGGHQAWAQLRSPELDAAYESLLATLDMTDTLVAVAER